LSKTSYENRLSIRGVGNETTQFFSQNGELLAVGYVRIVFGARGPYVEFLVSHLVAESFSETDCSHSYYIELRSLRDNVKVYAQAKPVDYADYVPGRFYISPFELYDKDGKVMIEPLRARK